MNKEAVLEMLAWFRAKQNRLYGPCARHFSWVGSLFVDLLLHEYGIEVTDEDTATPEFNDRVRHFTAPWILAEEDAAATEKGRLKEWTSLEQSPW